LKESLETKSHGTQPSTTKNAPHAANAQTSAKEASLAVKQKKSLWKNQTTAKFTAKTAKNNAQTQQ
jgi:hypothetical protein